MRNELSDLAAFALIANERSFTRAAERLGVSQSALSHSMRGLEKRLGIELLARTSRSVSPTAAGEHLLKELAPALEQIERSLNELRKRTVRPAGRIRLVIPRVVISTILMPKLAAFAREHPEVYSTSQPQTTRWTSLRPVTMQASRSASTSNAT